MRFELYVRCDRKPEKHFTEAVGEYVKRLGRYCSISRTFVRKEGDWKKKTAALGGSGKGKAVIEILPGKDSMTSEEFSEQIAQWETGGISRVCFLIPDTGKDADDPETPEEGAGNERGKMYLSSFTMHPEMYAMILCEQIYRGYRILHNQPYHK